MATIHAQVLICPRRQRPATGALTRGPSTAESLPTDRAALRFDRTNRLHLRMPLVQLDEMPRLYAAVTACSQTPKEWLSWLEAGYLLASFLLDGDGAQQRAFRERLRDELRTRGVVVED